MYQKMVKVPDIFITMGLMIMDVYFLGCTK